MKKILAAALALAVFVPAIAQAYPITPGSVAVHSYTNGSGARVGAYIRRAPGRATSAHGINGAVIHSSGGARISVRPYVRNNANGTQSLVQAHASSHQRQTVVTGNPWHGSHGPVVMPTAH